MAKNQTVRIRPVILQADKDAYTTLQAMEGYTPANINFSITSLAELFTDLQSAQQAEVNAQNALDAARDAAARTEWDFHNAMLGAKAQVLAQYGDDSDQAQAMGLKKKSERKSPVRKTSVKA